MNNNALLEQLEKNMTINGTLHPRFYHSVEVAKMATKLNEKLDLGLDPDDVYTAAILHDCAKLKPRNELWNILLNHESKEMLENIKNSELVWHSFAGKYVARDEYHLENEEILNAIYYHTTGRANMTTFEKLIFVSDYVESSRVGKCFDIAREEAFKSLDDGVFTILNQTLDYLQKNDKIICGLTVEAFNYYKTNRKN